jgi:putative hydrolase
MEIVVIGKNYKFMIKVDLHTHTVASGHAFSTIQEMTEEAARREVEILGITDHGPAISDGASLDYFHCGVRRLPREMSGVKILFGIEANIMNGNGDLDIDLFLQEKLDIVIASLHRAPGYIDLGREGNTQAIINAMGNPCVKIIGHPYGPANGLEVNIERIAEAACRENILLEVNAAYFFVEKSAEDAEKINSRVKKMVTILKANNKKVIINSDAHHSSEIGRDKEVREKFDYLGLTEDDVINNDIEAVKKYFNIKD